MKIKQKISPFLWLDSGAEKAAEFYVSVFKNSKILSSNPLVTAVEIEGLQIFLMNGGPKYKLNESFSFSLSCDTQEEIDYYWNKFTEDGEESRCGWLKDKFGVSWQVIPSILPELMNNAEKAGKVTKAFMDMRKLDIELLKKAAG